MWCVDYIRRIGILCGLCGLFFSSNLFAAWQMRTGQDGLCYTHTAFEHLREPFEVTIRQGDSLPILQVSRKRKKYATSISNVDAVLLYYADGKVVDLSKLSPIKLELNETHDIILAPLDKNALQALLTSRDLVIDYTQDRTRAIHHVIDMKFAASSMKEMQECNARAKLTSSAALPLQAWKFYQHSKEFELGCHGHVALKTKTSVYHLLYINNGAESGLIFIDKSMPDGRLQGVNHLTLTDRTNRLQHISVEGQLWELNGKDALFIPMDHKLLRQIFSGKKLVVNYSTERLDNIEQAFPLSQGAQVVNKVNKCPNKN